MLPDKHTFPFLLKSLNSVAHDANLAKLVHAHTVMFAFAADPFVQTALLSVYFACRSVSDALRLFDGIHERDVTTWTAVISGFVDQEFHEEAVNIFHDMRSQPEGSYVSPNVATMVSTMSACAGLGSLDLAKSLHTYIVKIGLEHDVFVQNSLIDSYAKCGSIGCAQKVFHCMSDKDMYSWTTMIMAMASHGLGKEALDVFSLMQQKHVVPDSTTFVALLTACSHVGLVDEGVKHFESMELFGLKPELKHYGCMVDLFSRAGLLDRAHELVSSMPLEPNLVILGSLLSACRVHGDLKLAKLVANKIDAVCQYHGGAHVLLSNIYADQSKWHEVVSIRKSTRGDDNKPQGQSWIEVSGLIHEFGVDDKSHPLTREMHLMLDELGKLMEEFLTDHALFL